LSKNLLNIEVLPKPVKHNYSY